MMPAEPSPRQKTAKKALETLNEKGKKYGVAWAAAATRANYRGDAASFINLIKSGDDQSLETVTRVLSTWNNLIKEKKQTIEKSRGAAPKAVPPTATNKVFPSSKSELVGLSHPEIDLILSAHNSVRSKYRKPPLEYHKALAERAQVWANHLVVRRANGFISGPQPHDPNKHVDGLGECGENLAAIYDQWPFGKYAPKHNFPVAEWEKEVANWDLIRKTSKGTGKYLHFTQLIWAGTRLVGCGFALVENPETHFHSVWVCKYYPAGNDESQMEKNT
jgi:hypothetical protein